MKRRWVFWTQVAIVVGLCVWSLVLLWVAGTAVVSREQNRHRVATRLIAAEEELAASGVPGLVLVPSWPESLGASEWKALDAWLADNATKVLGRGQPRLDGGYYLVGFDRFVGNTRHDLGAVDGAGPVPLPPQPARSLIEAQVQRALDEDGPQSLLVETPPHTLAIRTAPVRINGRKVAATWTLATLNDADALAAAVTRYRLSATLAVGGIAVALVLALWLALTVRKQKKAHSRLESDLRRTERLAALGKLVAGVAHEVRNPLAGIRSTAQLCQRGAQFDSETASDLMAEVDRLDMIVARLLQFSRIGREPLQQANLNEVVAEAMRMIRPKAEENNVLIEFNFDHGLPQVAIAASSIIQVVRNLAHNAVEAMPHGGVLRIGTGRQSPRKYVYVSISDTGCGLSRQVKEHLFEPFFTTKNDGTGLGLAIAREIALAHGGNLTAQDRAEGAGATFILSLPVEAPQHALAAPANQIVKDTPAVVPDSVNSQRVMIEL